VSAARRPAWLLTLVLLLVTLGVAYLATAAVSREGSVGFDLAWPQRLFGADDLSRNLLVSWRLPRVVAAMIVGAALSLAGLLLQGVTRNPLADPYLLGISGGAGLIVVFVRAMIPLPAIDWWLTPACAFLGATLATLLVIALARGGPRSEGRLTVVGLVLAGVVINALCAAMMQFILARLDPFHLRVTTLWLAGLEDLVATSPRVQKTRRIAAIEGTTRTVTVTALMAGVPAASLLLGVAVFLVRRRG